MRGIMVRMPDVENADSRIQGQSRTKSEIRAAALAQRLSRANDPADAYRFVEQFHQGLQHHISLEEGTIVSGYWAVKGEADPSMLIEYLRGLGCIIALPRHDPETGDIVFLAWEADTPLIEGQQGIYVPPLRAKEIDPAIIVAPLVAFDGAGNRIGYGAGFYDRAIRERRGGGRAVIVIGLGFADQQVPQIPTERQDETLDWLLTEESVVEIRP